MKTKILFLAVLMIASASSFSQDSQTNNNNKSNFGEHMTTKTSAVNLVKEDNAEIRSFQFSAPEEDLMDLRRRILATKWPERETDESQGVQLDVIKKVADYWANQYDWRKIEAKLNALPQYTTTIDGLEIHFIHVRSKHKNALPIIITHGWPGSITEQLKLIGPLTDPTAYGGSEEDAFDIVIPSLPGFGFSGKPEATGWEPLRIARAWITLMERLGYKEYVAQGGDWGALITELMGVEAPAGLLGIHTNMPSGVPEEIFNALQTHVPPPGLSPDEKRAFERLELFFSKGLGYALEMRNRPQTLYGIADSPIGLAAWFMDHDILSYELKARVFNGQREGLTRDDILDNITLAWLTNTAISSARIYWENKYIFFRPVGVKIPIAISAFPDELYQPPLSWMEQTYPKLIYFNKVEKGGHFAAWEQPKILSEELRKAFKQLRD
jgi:pimeloyl-ACP methyl ester carboxylesterase